MALNSAENLAVAVSYIAREIYTSDWGEANGSVRLSLLYETADIEPWLLVGSHDSSILTKHALDFSDWHYGTARFTQSFDRQVVRAIERHPFV
jgi:hypothetical protein